MNTNQTINRYNQDGSENMDYWFGVRETKVEINLVTEKPQYVRYSMDMLKKRSTRRLNKMHFTLFGTLTGRKSMIENLFKKLNDLWNNFTDFIRAAFGITGAEETNGKRGRKPKFEETQIYNMLQMNYCGYKLVEIAGAFNTNIATVSQTLNGKGTYAYIVNQQLKIRGINTRGIYC